MHADELTSQLKAVSHALQESRQMEASYREQLTKVIEDARIQRAECLEAKRITSDVQAKAYQWRTIGTYSLTYSLIHSLTHHSLTHLLT